MSVKYDYFCYSDNVIGEQSTTDFRVELFKYCNNLRRIAIVVVDKENKVVKLTLVNEDSSFSIKAVINTVLDGLDRRESHIYIVTPAKYDKDRINIIRQWLNLYEITNNANIMYGFKVNKHYTRMINVKE